MAGPFAAQRLGDLGADVVKIEPVTGEWQRHVPAGGKAARRINASFLSLNRNKRSLASQPEDGRGPRPSCMSSPARPMSSCRTTGRASPSASASTIRRCSAINPRLVYVSISGYGVDGPYVDYPGQDLLVQAMSGSMYSSGRESDPPQPAGQYVVDATTAYCAFEGALAALLHRERTGEGQLVEINMLDCGDHLPDAGALGADPDGPAPAPLRRAARPCLYPGPLRRLQDGRRLYRARLSPAGQARRCAGRAAAPRYGRQCRRLRQARSDPSPGGGEARSPSRPRNGSLPCARPISGRRRSTISSR